MKADFSRINEEMSIGAASVKNRLALAPMAGFTDISYRKIAESFGAGLTTTELCSAKAMAITGNIQKQLRYLEVRGLKSASSIQLFGSEPEDFLCAVNVILSSELGQYTDIIDINMGCPVKKLVKTGAGAALLKRPGAAEKIILSLKPLLSSSGKGLSVKMRTGFEKGENLAANFALRMAYAGADSICIHGRTREDFYSGKADMRPISEAVSSLRSRGLGCVKVYANGDIKDCQSAEKALIASSADGLAIGRAAMGNPFIFEEISEYFSSGKVPGEKNFERVVKVGKMHSEGVMKENGERAGCLILRSILPHYVGKIHGAAELRRIASSVSTAEDIKNFWELALKYSKL